MRKVPTGVVFLLAVAALSALAVADVRVATAAFREGTNYDEVLVGPDRVVLARSVEMHPGDRLYAHVEVPGANPRLFASYDFIVVQGGGRYALLEGNATSRAPYVRTAGIDPSMCCNGQLVAFDRPDDETYRREGSSQVDQPDLVDLAWVFEYRPGVVVPEGGAERRAFEAQVGEEFHRSPPTRLRDPVVFDERAVRLRPSLSFAMEVSAVVASVAAIAWAVQLHLASRADAQAGVGTEGLLRLYAAAGGFLTRLRDLVAGSVLAGLLLVLHLFIGFERAKKLGPAEEALHHGWNRNLGEVIPGLYLVVLAVSLYALWHVHRALARWRRRAAATPPLDL